MIYIYISGVWWCAEKFVVLFYSNVSSCQSHFLGKINITYTIRREKNNSTVFYIFTLITILFIKGKY